jgi:hypothetical protein
LATCMLARTQFHSLGHRRLRRRMGVLVVKRAANSTRHRWGEKKAISPHKSEQQCERCDVVRASRHEFEGGRELHWKEFWRDLERLDEAGETPPCDARREVGEGYGYARHNTSHDERV